MIRVALESASDPPAPEPDGSEALLRTAVAAAIRDRDADASEKAMRSLVDVAWRRVADDKGEGRP